MTTPSRIDEILSEMDQDQELAQSLRERILGEEYSSLPAAVAQNQHLIIGLMGRQVELAGATRTAMEAVVSSMEQIGDRTAAALETQNQRLAEVESALSELSEEGQKSQALLAQTQAGVNQLQTVVTEVQGDVKQLQLVATEVQADVIRMDGRLDRSFGANYEAKVGRNIRSILGQQAGIRNSKVMWGLNIRTDQEFEKQVENAEAAGVISEQETDELWLLDLIVSGTQRGTQDRVYVGVEVSITADANDVDRAADRPEILRKLTGGPALAVAVASRMDEPQRELAIRRGVETALHPE